MTVQDTTTAKPRVVDVAIDESFGWKRHTSGNVTVWFKGWIDGLNGAGLAAKFAGEPRPTPGQINAWLRGIDGHFAFVATGQDWTVAAVDWIRSIPLAACRVRGSWTIDAQPERLRRAAGLGAREHDPDAVLAIAMAGYAIDHAALYRGIELLAPGELFWIGPDGEGTRHRYYIYRPWQIRDGDPAARETELADITLAIMRRTLASLDGRPLAVPLSAGRDSRLVASTARHLGYDNVICFSYGRSGNFEAEAARAIADKLGYPWHFVPATITRQRAFFASDDYHRYLAFADSGASVPFVQDMGPLIQLKRSGAIPDDAVIINGNSGDFITGNHIVPTLRRVPVGLDEEQRLQRITDALVAKHFSLWQSLLTPKNRKRISVLLRGSLRRAGATLGNPACDHGLYEYAEFQDRQCKYVVTGQRIYEYLGHAWRLPLWDNAYLRFWEGVPLEDKTSQKLYARMLEKTNWGGVWRDVPVNRKTVRPRWLIPLRLFAMAMHAPLGRERWHRFERHYLQYWMEGTCSAACVPYRRVWRDRRGARNSVAWLTEHYLVRHGLDLNSLPYD
ncbi:MAG: asparagine synthase C-terminal domain-containing protein [Pseudolabrys sp.]